MVPSLQSGEQVTFAPHRVNTPSELRKAIGVVVRSCIDDCGLERLDIDFPGTEVEPVRGDLRSYWVKVQSTPG